MERGGEENEPGEICPEQSGLGCESGTPLAITIGRGRRVLLSEYEEYDSETEEEPPRKAPRLDTEEEGVERWPSQDLEGAITRIRTTCDERVAEIRDDFYAELAARRQFLCDEFIDFNDPEDWPAPSSPRACTITRPRAIAYPRTLFSD